MPVATEPAPSKFAGKASAGATAAATALAPDGSENRKAIRRPASDFPQITGLRFKPHGVEATLIDISETGLLAECGERLKPGSAVMAVFEGSFSPGSVEGRVARCAVWSVGRDGRLRYHLGIEFAKPCALGGDAGPASTPAALVARTAQAASATSSAPGASIAAERPRVVPHAPPVVVRNRW
jgi:hypothetical protein